MKNRMQEEFSGKDKHEPVRLNKFLAETGVCSRREADRLIESGKVTVDGQTAAMGLKVLPIQDIRVNGKRVSREEEMILLAVNKPVGIICTSEKKWGSNNIEDFLHYPKRIFSIGRLDKDSEGLLLMTNNGEILNKIMRAGNYHEKEYEVRVNRPVTDEFVRQMAKGVPILNTVTRPCKVEKIGEKQFRIILTQGLNRQIRRMCEALGYKVTRLVRVRIMNIRLGHLKAGTYRKLTDKEIEELYQMIQDSSNGPEYTSSI
ncbi:pseudouridine synthase [Robinsoniella peoriensis]|uniref:Pseudouridine synthase n=1 Tax=Robinsoniella peoriensis TaxID=180332 RepID=A0A4U8PYP8_9FIRM|nr:pseudouridine synthase [Robinsoniella peoriensis]MDU7031376.1 pseudouridine synthase [Clostridiales bacterium]TLC97501.1 Ribosomal large subunit pseudouridine synthase F [Robinsoniella peoriensis]